MDLKEIKRIVSLVEEANISSLMLETEGIKIEIKKELGIPVRVATSDVVPVAHHIELPVSSHKSGEGKPEVKAEYDSKIVAIKSPMVGTFYVAPNPDAAAYAKIGDKVVSGQVVCVIEAMKLFNEIESEYAGTIDKILLENASPVEYGQELFLVRLE